MGKWVVASKDEHWMVIEREVGEDTTRAGGQSWAYESRTAKRAILLEYGLCQGMWLGKIELVSNLPERIGIEPGEVWQLAYSLCEDIEDETERSQYYKDEVAHLDEDDILKAIAEYEPGAGDFVYNYAEEYDTSEWDVSATHLMLDGSISEYLVRRVLEDMARAYVLMNKNL